MKKHFTTYLLFAILILGLSLLLYPTVSDYWNSFHQSAAVASYMDTVKDMDDDRCDRLRQQAEAYNADLPGFADRWNPTAEEHRRYTDTLDVTGTGIMCSIEIPSLGLTLPVYHTTEEDVLQIAVGHIEGSSLPVGGPGTHCVLSGHRGLPSARLFTDLDKLREGDIFSLCTMREVLTYEVDKIRIVLPYETQGLSLEPGRDLCTLVTCTPYGVNTHRLLVRGHRIDSPEAARNVRVTSDAVLVDPLLVAPVVAIPLLILLFIWFLKEDTRRAERKKHAIHPEE